MKADTIMIACTELPLIADMDAHPLAFGDGPETLDKLAGYAGRVSSRIGRGIRLDFGWLNISRYRSSLGTGASRGRSVVAFKRAGGS